MSVSLIPLCDKQVVADMKMYSRSGDGGETSLYGGLRTKKVDVRVEAYGSVDELSCALGVARSLTTNQEIKRIVFSEQLRLFRVAADLATPLDAKAPKPIKRISEEDVKQLEETIDSIQIKQLDKFVVPGATAVSAQLHFARTVCRRAERTVWRLLSEAPNVNRNVAVFLNRLSTLLFVLARYVNDSEGVQEDLWVPDASL
jgi:cob(I)alamin adenosyltransferase